MKFKKQYSALLLGLLGLLMSLQVIADALKGGPDYSSGMSSYMVGDYEAAKLHWLNSAQNSNARAMFNLGLLHERQLISGANAQRAEYWFQQSGEAGHAAADYHLALKLEQIGQNTEASALMRRAANSGFVLAQERLGIEPSVSVKSDASVTNSEAKSGAGSVSGDTVSSNPSSNPSAAPSLLSYNREGWVMNQSQDAWTIQMLAFSDESKVVQFIDAHGLHKNAAYFAEGNGDNVVYKLIYGAYPSKQNADEARQGFTSSLKEHGPWLRPIRAVQAIIKKS